MSESSYRRIKAWLKASQLERLYFIARIGFEDQHMQRINQCELMLKMHWQNVREEKSPYRRSMILKEIREMQPLLSSYYEATTALMKETGRLGRNGERNCR